MQMEEGIWYPMGGTRAVPEALVKLATELGVVFHTKHGRGEDYDHLPSRGSNGKGAVATGLVTTAWREHMNSTPS